MRIERAGLRLAGRARLRAVDPENDPRFREYWEPTAPDGARRRHARGGQGRGAALEHADLGADAAPGEADAMLCGLVGRYDAHLEHVRHVIGQRPARAPWRR
jgi:malate dehydrogenase (oxaloacetate-decarboxylating)(NADP+)